MKRRMFAWSAVLSLGASCGDTGQDHVTLKLATRGSDARSLEVDGATFVLQRAEVAVGPVYFCAAEGADTSLCDAALAELTEVVTVDALAPQSALPQKVHGVTGEVRSAIYDYGVSWFLTEQAPAPSGSAQHSAVLEGDLSRDGRTLHFVAEIDAVPLTVGASAVHGQHTRCQLGEVDVLTLVVDPYLWLRPVDVEALFALDPQATGKVTIAPGSQAYEAILQGMQNRAPVQFEWR